MIRVVIVDDHPIVRKGLRQTLSETGDIEVSGEAGSASEFQSLPAQTPCDVLLLDIALPGRSGLDILADVKSQRPRLPVIILSNHSEVQYAVRALKGGAAGYLTKVSAPEELITAIRRVASGRRYVSPAFAEQMAELLAGDAEVPPHERLSARELEIFRMIARGMKPHEIAETLHLSVKTVGTYRFRILQKMNVSSNAELARYAAERGL